MNPIKWFFRDKDIREKEKVLDDHLERIRSKVEKFGETMMVEIDIDFPKNFTELSEEISKGNIKWRDFYSNKILDIYSAHCKMQKGSIIKEHVHPKFDEYIYVISGSVIGWTESGSEAKIVGPPEKIDSDDKNTKGWHKISAGINHRIQCIEDNTHFVSKFLKTNVESD